MMLEITVEYEALASKLEKKKAEAPNKLADTINESGLNAQELLMIASPVDKGNLRASHHVENKGLLERVIFPDEGVAPYAWYVILGHRTRRFTKSHGQQKWVPGNDYPKRAYPLIRKVVEENLNEFITWLSE